jgi:hypothetical protein
MKREALPRGHKEGQAMEGGKDFIPEDDWEFGIFFLNVCQCALRKTSGLSPAWPHIPDEEIERLVNANVDWSRAHALTFDDRAEAAAAAKEAARKLNEPVLRAFVLKWILRFPEIVGRGDLEQLGIPAGE